MKWLEVVNAITVHALDVRKLQLANERFSGRNTSPLMTLSVISPSIDETAAAAVVAAAVLLLLLLLLVMVV